jgi:isopenicillin-N N-acyltransferase-like protein
MSTRLTIGRRDFLTGAAALGLHASLSPLAQAAGPRSPFPELKLSGSPGAVGLAHGRAFAKQIKSNVAVYLRLIAASTRTEPAKLLKIASTFGPVLKRHLPAQLEEIEGIAKGAGRSLAEILMLNARSDLKMLDLRAPAKPGCTSLALTGRHRGRPLLALGQNWDWRRELAKGVVVLRIKPKKGPHLVTFTEAGMVGKIGFNEHRVGVCLNFLRHATASQWSDPGVPVHCLLRAVMECSSLEEAYKLVAWAPRCGSANFLMAQHGPSGPQALDLEIAPDAVARITLGRDGFLVHTNHYKAKALVPGCTGGRGRSTTNRDTVATSLARRLGPKIPDPVKRMKRILSSTEGSPYGVSKIGAPDSPTTTLAGIVMDLSRNRLHLVAGLPHRGRWVTRRGP